MNNYPNKNVKNVKSPKNEKQYINAYKELNPRANRKDNLDVAAVVSVSGDIREICTLVICQTFALVVGKDDVAVSTIIIWSIFIFPIPRHFLKMFVMIRGVRIQMLYRYTC